MMRLAAAQIAGWKARLTVRDLEVAGALLDAVEPLSSLQREVACGRRQLAVAHAAALEQRLVGADSFRRDDPFDDDRATYAVVLRLRKIAVR